MAARTKLIRAKDVLASHLEHPEFRAEWERSALARAVAVAVVGYRAKHQLTQAQFAKRLGVRQPHIARLEMGEHNPNIEMLQRLSRVLGVRFIVEVGPATRSLTKAGLKLPHGVKVLEDVVTRGSRVRIAAG